MSPRLLPLAGPAMLAALAITSLGLAGLLAGCTGGSAPVGGAADDETGVSTDAPPLGACRRLTPADVTRPADATATVDCTAPHTAETYAVGPLPGRFAAAAYDDEALGRFAYRTCSTAFAAFLGADESQTMRTVVTWAWFRPSAAAWSAGARWYRCDVVGGGDQSRSYVDLPVTAKGLLQRSPDRWMVCVDAPTIAGEKIPCSQPHTWRAVTTIVVGDAGTAYPGEKVAEARSRDYCSTSVGAWLGYPADYDYGYTFFHAGEWAAGNRRSVCWARTSA